VGYAASRPPLAQDLTAAAAQDDARAPPSLASRPVYVSLLPDRVTPGGGYRHVTDVRASVVLREAAKETAVREVVASIQRYLSLLALVGEEDDVLRQWMADVETEALAAAD
jgi:hypothetical protein